MNWLRSLTTFLMALLLAVAVWLYAVDRTQETARFTLPVTVRIAEPSRLHVAVETPRIEAVFKGPRGAIERLRTEGPLRGAPVIVLTENDLPSEIPDPMTYGAPLHARHLGAIDRSISVEFAPDTATLRLTPTAMFTVRVRADIANNIPAGLRVDRENIVVEPAAVSIFGPANLMNAAEPPVIETVSIPLTGVAAPQTFTFNSVALKQTVGGVAVSADTQVKVIVPVVRDQVQREVRNVPVQLLMPPNFPHDISLLDETVTITVRGAREDVDALTPDRIVAALPIVNEIPRPVPYTKRLIVIIPEGPAIQLDGEPPMANFLVAKRDVPPETTD